MQSTRQTFFAGALIFARTLVFPLLLLGAAGPAMADDEALCDALEQARDPLYEVPMGTEDWNRINALEHAARALDCAFMINE